MSALRPAASLPASSAPAGPGPRPRRPRSGRRRVGLALTALGGALATVVTTPGIASAVPAPDYEMPFVCGQSWTGSTRSSHSPSVYSVDFNRADDLGQPTLASAPGWVSRVADTGGSSYGKYVIVDHGAGDSTLYAHLQATWVTTGQRVDQGQLLGLVGSSGGSTGPHLHFEERHDGRVVAPYFHQARFAMPRTQVSQDCPDVPIAGDWAGDGSTEVGVFRRNGTPAFRLQRPGQAPQVIAFGRASDQPVTGDWDGDGATDVGVWRPGWSAFLLRLPDGSTRQVATGRVSDVPLTGDWDGDGDTEVGVWTPSTGQFGLRGADGAVTRVSLGGADDLPLSGDWNADGRSDLGVYDTDSGVLTARVARRDGTVRTRYVTLGTGSDIPVVGDWDGNGADNLGVWAPTTRRFSLRVTPVRMATTRAVSYTDFGRRR